MFLELLGASLENKCKCFPNFSGRVPEEKHECLARSFGRVPEETRECLTEFFGAFLKKRASVSWSFWARS